MKKLPVLLLLLCVLSVSVGSVSEGIDRGYQYDFGDKWSPGWYSVSVDGSEAGSFYMPDGSVAIIPFDSPVSIKLDFEKNRRESLLHAGDAVDAASDRFSATAKFSAQVDKIFELKDQGIFVVESGETMAAGVDIYPGWYRLFYIGDKDATASLSRDAVKTDNGLFLFGEQASNLAGIKPVPFATFSWLDSDGSRFDFVDFPIPEGTQVSFEATGSSDLEQLWMFLVERM